MFVVLALAAAHAQATAGFQPNPLYTGAFPPDSPHLVADWPRVGCLPALPAGPVAFITPASPGWPIWTPGTTYFIDPGDYSSFGALDLSGLVGVALVNTSCQHPILAGARASVQRLLVNDGHDVFIEGLEVLGADSYIAVGSTDVVVNRTLIQGGLVPGSLLNIEDDGTDRITVQNSVLRNALNDTGLVEANCIRLAARRGGVQTDIHILNNELANCSDGVVTNGGSDHSARYNDLVVHNNDIYVDDDAYVAYYAALGLPNFHILNDCELNRIPNGNCGCVENGVDLKQGADNGHPRAQIQHNRLWGWRVSSDHDMCDNLTAWGWAIAVNFETDGVIVSDNLVWDSAGGVSVMPEDTPDPNTGAPTGRPSDYVYRNIDVYNNLFADIYDSRNGPGVDPYSAFFPYKRYPVAYRAGLAFNELSFVGNSIVDDRQDREIWNQIYTESPPEVDQLWCNAVIGAGSCLKDQNVPLGASRDTDSNAWFGVTPIADVTHCTPGNQGPYVCDVAAGCHTGVDAWSGTIAGANHVPFTFRIRRWTGLLYAVPPTHTIANALPTALTPLPSRDTCVTLTDPDPAHWE